MCADVGEKKSEPNHCRLGIFFPNGGGLGLGKCPQNALKHSGLGIITRQFIAASAEVTTKVGLIRESYPKMSEKFRLRISSLMLTAPVKRLPSNTEPNRVFWSTRV